jgi:hypothetical protein
VNACQKEPIDLLDAIWTGKPYDEGWAGATSSFTAVIARMASYSGAVIKWDEAVQRGPSLFPKDMSWDADPPVMPDRDGRYEHAVAVPAFINPIRKPRLEQFHSPPGRRIRSWNTPLFSRNGLLVGWVCQRNRTHDVDDRTGLTSFGDHREQLMRYIVYETETGQILRTGICDKDQLANQAGPG